MGGASNDSGMTVTIFGVLLSISSETLEIRPALIYNDMQSVVSFSVSPKCVTWMTLNGYFTLNSVIAPVCQGSDCAVFENNCVKANKDRPILSAPNIFGRDSSFWQYKVIVDIHADSVEKGVKGQWGHVLTVI